MNNHKVVIIKGQDAIYGQMDMTVAQANQLRSLGDAHQGASIGVWVEEAGADTVKAAKAVFKQLHDWAPQEMKSSKIDSFDWSVLIGTGQEIDEWALRAGHTKRVNLTIQAGWVPGGVWHAEFDADLTDPEINILPGRAMRDLGDLLAGRDGVLVMDQERFPKDAAALLGRVRAYYNRGVGRREDAALLDALIEVVGAIIEPAPVEHKRKSPAP